LLGAAHDEGVLERTPLRQDQHQHRGERERSQREPERTRHTAPQQSVPRARQRDEHASKYGQPERELGDGHKRGQRNCRDPNCDRRDSGERPATHTIGLP
jgi:hypothetical protein